MKDGTICASQVREIDLAGKKDSAKAVESVLRSAIAKGQKVYFPTGSIISMSKCVDFRSPEQSRSCG